MAFSVPMVWRELTNHTDDCYFYFNLPIKAGLLIKKKETIQSIFHFLFDLFYIQLVYQFLFHPNIMRLK